MRGSILIVDDEPALGRVLQQALERDGLRVQYRPDPEAGLALLKERPFDILITDLMMPGIDGITLLSRAKRIRPACEVVVITAFATVDTAREALKRGAVDFLTKPFSIERDLKPLIRGILETPAGDEAEVGGPEVSSSPSDALAVLQETAGENSEMADLLRTLPRIARSGATTLLRGESGTGKELIASALHQLSQRADKPFVRVNCAGLPEMLLESELFGAVKGAYTGSDHDRIGLFEAASGGTLLLDEIGELSAALQPKLLRVLQDGEFFRLGDPTRTIQVDVHIIASTNRDLTEAIDTGAFRSDLYYRLNVISIFVPPLRKRTEQLHALIERFAARFGKGAAICFSPSAIAAFENYSWPGNIRELENAVQHALVLRSSDRIEVEDLPVSLQDVQRELGRAADSDPREPRSLDEIEIHCILQTLVKTDFNRARAARLLGLTRRALGYRIQKYNLQEELDALRSQDSKRRLPHTVKTPHRVAPRTPEQRNTQGNPTGSA